ncbi:nuclear transport factor 2 family protein [Streptomyces prunicolor]|uniref:Nuclear transport factor 2 family protein n=1 Tax=Streptomyces prunicolor TaxID=67348 RepID=A0ABU4FTW3_9ACTN|nr:nuclear transport factor 2 family protein [Streptomyces prunicolor]MCX5236675.1 nuclear transport factor 2 family protein [Streptomyces prunicolor]MDV7224032.1 nuclear transport factor 2 family protein [Streptomyces prunicolor]
MNSPQTTSPATVPTTADRLDLITVCSRLGHHVDFREWDRLPALFAPSVLVRHTGSDTPGEPVPTPRDAVVAQWREARERVLATHHLVTNHLVSVTGDTATATAMFQSTHVVPGESGPRRLARGGRYVYGFARTATGWQITAITIEVLWDDRTLA